MREAYEKRIGWLLPLATGFGLGYSPYLPGTVGSLWGPVLVWAVQLLPGAPGPAQWGVMFGMMIVGIPICDAGRFAFRRDDPGGVVFDEITAFLIVFAFVEITVFTAIVGFVLFRVFDIWKPWPVKELEWLPGGLGIMADDTLAGLYAAAGLQFVVWGTTLAQG